MQIDTDASTYLGLIPERLENSNKGTYGKVLIIAGCKGMSGAAFLSGLAAYRTGAGLVKFLTAEENRTILQTLLPEAVFEGYDENSDLERIAGSNINWADVIVLGPGLGASELSRELLAKTLKRIREQWLCPEIIEKKMPFLIIDADGLNILSTSDSYMKEMTEISEQIPVVITPHPMEMSRLVGKTVSEILEAPENTASAFAKDHGFITLLKGSSTVVSDKTGEKLFKNLKSSPALSKGGSGDVLSGAIAGIYTLLRASQRASKPGFTIDRSKETSEKVVNPLYSIHETNHVYHSKDHIENHEMSQECTNIKQDGMKKQAADYDLAYNAVVLAVLIHAEAGRKASEHFGVNGVLARDTADCLGIVIDENELHRFHL